MSASDQSRGRANTDVATFPVMKKIDQVLDRVILMEPTVFGDDRGSFYESYNQRRFEELTGFGGYFVQDNHSTSVQGVLRGIHYQLPNPQGKLVRCVEGKIWDVAVDLRQSSPTFRQWKGYQLTADNRHQLWIPEGFGHGFLVLSERAQVLYRATELWNAENDRAIRWDDPDLDVDWPLDGTPILSEKDSTSPPLREALLFD